MSTTHAIPATDSVVPGPKDFTARNATPGLLQSLFEYTGLAILAGIGLLFSSLGWGHEFHGAWLLTPLLTAAMLRSHYKRWPMALIAVTVGGLAAACLYPNPNNDQGLVHMVISLPIAALGAFMIDTVFDRSKRHLTLRHAGSAILLVAIIPSAISASIAVLMVAGSPLRVWQSWFTSDMIGGFLLLPMALVYRNTLLHRLTSLGTARRTAIAFFVAYVASSYITDLMLAPQLPVGVALLCICAWLGLVQSIAVITISLCAMTLRIGMHAETGIEQYLSIAATTYIASMAAILVNQMRSERDRLVASEARFRDVMRFSPIGLGLSTPQGQFTLINESLCRMIGFNGREMAFKHLGELTIEETRNHLAIDIQQLVDGKTPLLRRDVQLTHKDGHSIAARLAVSAMRDGAGRAVSLVVQIEDFDQMERAREALRTSEERFEFAVNGSDIGVWDLNLATKTGFYSICCQEILGLSGIDHPTSMEDFCEHVYFEDRADTLRVANEHLAGHADHFQKEHRVIQSAGRIVWVLTRGKVTERDKEGRAIRMVGTMTDITQRKQAELALEQMHERTQLANEAARIGVWEWPVDADSVIWDDRMFEIFGLKSDDFFPNNINCFDLLDAHDAKRARKTICDAIHSSDTTFEFETRFIRADGQPRHARNLGTIVRDAKGNAIRLVSAYWDTTERAQLQLNLRDERNRLAVSLNAIADAVITTDERGRITFMNPAALQMMGVAQENAVGNDVFQLFTLHDVGGSNLQSHPVQQSLDRRERGDIILPSPDTILKNSAGTTFDVELTVSPMISEEVFMGSLVAVHDVTNNKEMQRKLSHAASHDALTGLHNRSHFESELQRHLEHAKAENLEHVLCFVDLDRFKIVNDSAGHSVGDILLRNVSKVISQCVRNSDVLARLGGDEFGILLLNCSIAKAQTLAEKIIETISGIRFTWEGNVYDIGASIGIVVVNADSKSIADVMSQADVACYAAKHGGRNRCSAYEDGQTEVQRHHKEIFLAAGLRDAIESDRLVLYGQMITPIQEQETNAGPGRHYELLVRLLNRDGTMIPPGAFIPAAERFELMARIDRWVIQAALKRFGSRIARVPHMSVGINLSANSLSDETFLPFLLEVLAATDVRPENIEFEVTETSLMNHMSIAVEILAKLRDLGCRVALDDFGAGLSSYTYLKNFKVDTIKIDGSFIKHVHVSNIDWTIVESMNQVAHRLGAETTAEFVENEDILAECKRIGIDYAQGYGLHKPEPLDGLLAAVESRQ